MSGIKKEFGASVELTAAATPSVIGDFNAFFESDKNPIEAALCNMSGFSKREF